jgi:two-component system sensor histidine kinase KdpD
MATSTEQRPDPDALLAKVKQQEAQAQRGKLRIYFGSSAGVGKTYAMLAAARKQRSGVARGAANPAAEGNVLPRQGSH